MYRAWSQETGKVSFVRRRLQDPVFTAYRNLARESDAAAVWQVDRAYHGLPGYYYLHRRILLYDAFTGRGVSQDLATLSSSVSHLLVADAAVAVAGYSLEREFGGLRILRRDAGGPPVRQWQEYTPTPVHESEIRVMGRVDANAPTPPPNAGIRLRGAVTAGGQGPAHAGRPPRRRSPRHPAPVRALLRDPLLAKRDI